MRCRYTLGLLCVAGVLAAAPARAAVTERASLGAGGLQANAASVTGRVSADGRWVAFDSDATNLVAGDSNGRRDVFVRDRLSGATERVSVTTGAAQANHDSRAPAISGDGRYVAFQSIATNLVPGDTNPSADVFVRDRVAGTTTRVSVATDGGQASDHSEAPALSADGRFVAFRSPASDLGPGDTNGTWDVFVHDRQTGATERVSVATGGGQANSMSTDLALSADGRFVVFASIASSLVSGDTNGAYDIFVRDRQAGTTERVSVATGGTQASGNSALPALSADGRFVAFQSYAANLVAGDTNGAYDVFLRDRQAGTTGRVSVAGDGTQGNGYSTAPALSADGRLVSFQSVAGNLVAGDTGGLQDVFVRDRGLGTTQRVSVTSGGGQAGGDSFAIDLSADGLVALLRSGATNLVAADTNASDDLFVRVSQCPSADPGCGTPPTTTTTTTATTSTSTPSTTTSTTPTTSTSTTTTTSPTTSSTTSTSTSSTAPSTTTSTSATTTSSTSQSTLSTTSTTSISTSTSTTTSRPPTTSTSTTTTAGATTTTTTPPPYPGLCAPAPLPGCRAPIEPHRASLQLKDRTPDSGDLLVWKWRRGAATAAAEFGVPGDTDYALCVYGPGGVCRIEAYALAADATSTGVSWRDRGSRGQSYVARYSMPGGLASLSLRPGDAGRAAIAAKARGAQLGLPPLGDVEMPLTVQLQGNGRCWGATYRADGVLRDEPTQLKALGD